MEDHLADAQPNDMRRFRWTPCDGIDPFVEPWLRSVLDISSPHWRAQVMAWLMGAQDVLNGVVRWPSEFSMKAHPDISWEWSHCLRTDMAAADGSGAPPGGDAHSARLSHHSTTRAPLVLLRGRTLELA